MKNFIFFVLISVFLLSPVLRAEAQSNTDTNTDTSSKVFDTTGFPQWVKDMRRWDIIAFGVFPFALFFTTMANDLNRWNNHNRDNRYAPWPFKPAGAVEMTTAEFNRVLLQAACVAAAVAFTDLIIVLIKRNNERKRLESKSKSSAVIDIKPYGTPPEDASPSDVSEAGNSGKN